MAKIPSHLFNRGNTKMSTIDRVKSKIMDQFRKLDTSSGGSLNGSNLLHILLSLNSVEKNAITKLSIA